MVALINRSVRSACEIICSQKNVPGRLATRQRGWLDKEIEVWRGGVYCSVTLPVSAGGRAHQDIKYAAMLTESVC